MAAPLPFVGVPVGVEDAWVSLAALLGTARDPRTDEIAVEHGDRFLYLTVLPFGPDSAVVQVMAPLLGGVVDSDELCAFVATTELRFGRLLIVDDGTGSRSVLHVIRFHADQLCADVLGHTLSEVAANADRIEPDLDARFGATFTLEGPG